MPGPSDSTQSAWPPSIFLFLVYFVRGSFWLYRLFHCNRRRFLLSFRFLPFLLFLLLILPHHAYIHTRAYLHCTTGGAALEFNWITSIRRGGFRFFPSWLPPSTGALLRTWHRCRPSCDSKTLQHMYIRCTTYNGYWFINAYGRYYCIRRIFVRGNARKITIVVLRRH